MDRNLLLALGAGAALAPFASFAADSIGEAVKESKFTLNWRLREETVDDAAFADEADALTSRVRAGLRTGQLAATSLLAEAVWVADVAGDYNSTTNGEAGFPVVADPDFAAVNQFAIVNESLEGTTLTFGRQRIIHDDARFVGNVGWRQNEQTYDALRVQFAGQSLEAELGYASKVNRIFGPDSPAGEWNGDFVLSRLAYPLGIGTLTGFGYVLDIDEAPALSSRTVGARLAGSKPAGDLEVSYTFALARQTDAGANPTDYSESYYQLEGGLGFGKLALAAGFELLGGDGVSSFTTPLATLHAFQGWADKFLATPAAGLEDRYLRLGFAFGAHGPFTALALTAVRHEFGADAGSADLGSETDLSFVARTARLALTFKLASFEAGAISSDTDKAWFSVEYSL